LDFWGFFKPSVIMVTYIGLHYRKLELPVTSQSLQTRDIRTTCKA